MKKFFLSFLILNTCYLILNTNSCYAFNLLDLIYPPLNLKDSSRKPPKVAPAPEIISHDSFSNTLETPLNCDGAISLSRHWDPKQEQTGTDADGNPIYEFVAQDARDLNGEIDIKNLSNNGFRNFHTWSARNPISCNPDLVDNNFHNLSVAGQGSANRMTPGLQILYLRGLLLIEAAQSLNQTDKQDLITQDAQLVWSCGGSCVELSHKPKSCRPVTISEILYGLRGEPLYYSSATSSPATFPSDIISKLAAYFNGNCSSVYGCFQKRFPGVPFSPLSLSDYLLIFHQLNPIPRGNVDNKVTVTRYGGYDTVAQKKILPSPTVFHRNLPNAAALFSNQAPDVVSLVNPGSQQPLPGTDLCNNTTVNPPTTDRPPPASILLFVLGLFKHLAPGESYDHSETNEIKSSYDPKIVNNSAKAENTFINLIPAEEINKNNLVGRPFASKTDTNKDFPLPDPFNRGNDLYTTFGQFLRPAAW